MIDFLRPSKTIKRVGTSLARFGLLPVMMLLTILTISCSSTQKSTLENTPQSDSDPVLSILRVQVEAWNDGDIERFMEYYWKSDDLTFSSGGKITRGWSQTLANYKRRYPTPEKMGRTRFDDLEVFPLGDDAALVLGEWHLERQTNPMHGNFSLVFQKIDGEWLIIHDHTSRAPEEGEMTN